jgi:predicted DNA-binding protein (MmcQ/YjbR family)
MLTYDALREYCLKQIGAVEEFPFGPEARVFKVMGKMFALMPVDADPPRLNLTVDPFIGEVLRENYKAVTGAYHMNKKHWITLVVDGEVPDDEVRDMIDASYDLVVSGLTRKDREALRQMKP